MIQVELQRWSGVFSSSGMDLPNYAKVFLESLAKILERKGTNRKRRKVRPCNGIHWGKQVNQCQKNGVEKEKWNNNKEMV